MSATRKGARRAEADFYPTPSWTVAPMLRELALPGGDWLEPGAGDGAIVRAVAAAGRTDVRWTALELRVECRDTLVEAGAHEVIVGNFMVEAAKLAAAGRRFDVAIGNPPFSSAFAFVRLALELADNVVMLERSPWIGDAADRFRFFRTRMPNELRVGRVDFDGRGGDSIPYSWFHWQTTGRGGGALTRSVGSLVLLARPHDREPGNAPPRRQLTLCP